MAGKRKRKQVEEIQICSDLNLYGEIIENDLDGSIWEFRDVNEKALVALTGEDLRVFYEYLKDIFGDKQTSVSVATPLFVVEDVGRKFMPLMDAESRAAML